MQMAMTMLASAGSTLGSTAAAGSAAAATAGGTAATTAVASAGSGITLANVLQGALTLFSVASVLDAGEMDAQVLEFEAEDAEMEVQLETLQGLERRKSIKRGLLEAVGAQDVAYGASGVDLSFGTAKQARADAFREADFGLENDNQTQTLRASRLTERANFKRAAARSKKSGSVLEALTVAGKGISSIVGRGG